tara:strand:+ start:170 stop:1030 length:861 start_codon:yes stop_codon:yes gene_type:complete
MNLNLKEITFIIVSYKAKKVIYNCINSLPKFSKIIVIDNSSDQYLKSDLESKYDNIEVILKDNNGMGEANNIGLKKTNTKFAFILNPDVTFKENTFQKLEEAFNDIEDFSILSPIHEDKSFPNYTISKKYKFVNENIFEVDEVDGYSMLINKNKFNEEDYFDENFFLYLENVDLCLRQKKKNQKIYIVKNSEIKHIGSYTSKLDETGNIEYLRNWHWMWSKFYFNKKHYGYLIALLKTFSNFLSAIFKYLYYSLLFNKHKKNIYKMRFLGLISSIIGKKSYLRPKN